MGTSPCIGAGTDDTGTYPDLPTDDLLGVTRTDRDMGAYEYVGP